MDLIITDHHLSDEAKGNPDAFAVVNPNQPDCEYPDKNLAGVGVAFKLAHALLREKGKENLVEGFLKVVAHRHGCRYYESDGRKSRDCHARLTAICRKRKNFGLKSFDGSCRLHMRR